MNLMPLDTKTFTYLGLPEAQVQAPADTAFLGDAADFGNSPPGIVVRTTSLPPPPMVADIAGSAQRFRQRPVP